MTLLHITLKNIRLHIFKVAVLVAGLAIGVATVVSLLSDLENKLDEYGANMVVTPDSKSLPLTYGGVSLGGFSYDAKLLTESDAAKIRTIKNAANINIVAPKLMGLAAVDGRRSVIVGVRFADELKLKKWWKITKGAAPKGRNDILVGGKV
ncbi:MAG: ABC transporter permease, partial [Chloroflexi bacterium]|nr:ABC transporter permease [Chloroflexota bacterium]